MAADRFRFRIWCKERKMMALDVQNEYDTITGVRFSDGSEPGEDSFGSYLRMRQYIVMQSTGLEDSAGVEIFEGDVVRFLGDSPHVIEWQNGGFGFWGMGGKEHGDFVGLSGHGYLRKMLPAAKVVGNVHIPRPLLTASAEGGG